MTDFETSFVRLLRRFPIMIDFEKCCGKAVVGGAKGVIIGSAAGTLLGNIFAPVTSTVGAAVGGVIGAVLGLFTD